MAVHTTNSKAGPYVADGTQRDFPFRFPVIDHSHLAVYLDGGRVDSGEYTIYDEGQEGGSVRFTVPPKSGERVTLLRDIPLTQETDIQNNTAFYPEVLETAFDKLTMICQQFAEELQRVVKTGVGETDVTPEALLKSVFDASVSAQKSSRDAAESADAAQKSSRDAAESADAVQKVGETVAKRSGIPIGSMYPYSANIPPEGAYLLNGQTITKCSTLYPDFWEWVNTAGVRVIDNATFEAELASAGVCGGFAVNSAAGSVRLPHIVNGTLWGADSTNVGKSLAAGLPDIELALRADTYASNAYSKHLPEYGTEDKGGALPNESTGTDEPMVATGSASMADRGGDLIKSAVYGNSDTVQPPAVRVSWCIQVFNAATALSEQDSAHLASELQMRAQTDFGNVTANIDFIIKHEEAADGSWWYDLYRSGKVEQGGVTYTNSVITFPVEFSNASDYCILGTYDENGRGTAISFENRQETGATVKASWTSGGSNGYTTEAIRLSWYACGKTATE